MKSQFNALIHPTTCIFPFVNSFIFDAVKSGTKTQIFSCRISVKEANSLFKYKTASDKHE